MNKQQVTDEVRRLAELAAQSTDRDVLCAASVLYGLLGALSAGPLEIERLMHHTAQHAQSFINRATAHLN